MAVEAVDAPTVEGTKRSSEDSPAGESPAKVIKTEDVKSEVKDEIKAELKEEIKAEVKKEESEKTSEKKEKKEHKEHKEGKEGKEGKEKKEKKEKHKDKEKKEKSDKKEKKESKPPSASPEVKRSPDNEINKDLDQRKLFKDGQRFLTPPVADATRAFYESLYEENPESKIAIRFCVEYGLRPAEEHKKIFKNYNRLKDKGAYDARILIAKSLSKGLMKSSSKEKDKKDKKDKSEKKEKKEKSEKKEEKTTTPALEN